MQLVHKIGEKTVSRETDKETSFLLTNNRLGYTYFSNQPLLGRQSRYMGVFFPVNKSLFRVLAELRPDRDFHVRGFVNKFYRVERELTGNREVFFMPSKLNSLVYRLRRREPIRLCLDVRPSYEPDAFGRFYKLSEVDGKLLVEYTKRNPESGEQEYLLYIAVKTGKLDYEKICRWKPVNYELDGERNSPPVKLSVYDLARIRAKKLVISFSPNKNKALNEADYVYENLRKLEDKQRRYVGETAGDSKLGGELFFAYSACKLSLDQLTVDGRIRAGLPWFFQIWSRDELLSMKHLSPVDKKRIIYSYLDRVQEDGRIPNIVGDDSGTNADSVGWLFKRLDECFAEFTLDEREHVLYRFMESISRLKENYISDVFLMNGPGETWMDTVCGGGGRPGYRIEIQSMLLRMYALGYRLTRLKKRDKSSNLFSLLEEDLSRKVREHFWKKGMLLDGLGDQTARPNIFIAAYVYPEFLSKREWVECFRNTLSRLWLSWGGLSSIDKSSELFIGDHTGERPESYHRGDSWFFLNNMAALVLHRLGGGDFRSYVDAIVKASTDDILWDGMLGHHSELSSAALRESCGCGMQAWSSAMYLELIDEIYGK
ncbi:MAG: amylo-alpha-1,6-glucosidase [Candidatus Altiarchaeota archaeon]|nr:amylo-alpha-1,6-glucosidase [Candidatus Altiarchaeota archaeon]